jgi:hypothetical protein
MAREGLGIGREALFEGDTGLDVSCASFSAASVAQSVYDDIRGRRYLTTRQRTTIEYKIRSPHEAVAH